MISELSARGLPTSTGALSSPASMYEGDGFDHIFCVSYLPLFTPYKTWNFVTTFSYTLYICVYHFPLCFN
jgi:hypothetical protein